MDEAEKPNFLEKIWAQIRKHTKVNETDPVPLKIFKWLLLLLLFCVGIILSPVIIVVLIFALMISI